MRRGKDQIDTAVAVEGERTGVGLILPVSERDIIMRTAGWSDQRAMAVNAYLAVFDSLYIVDHFAF